MNITNIQNALISAGYNPGGVDGALGPHTYAAIFSYCVQHHTLSVTLGLGSAAVDCFNNYQINTVNRIANFIGQAAHETMGFQFFTELGGPSYFAKYDTMPSLGNTQPGDGYLFRGRGIFQITGRWNYQRYSTLTGVDLIANPDRAADPDVAMTIAGLFWSHHGLNSLADNNDMVGITKVINGGQDGLAQREAYTNRLISLLNS